MQALVLVGGEGTRLRPLTERVPKPALPLAGRPFLSYMVDWLAGHGVSEVVLACGFLPDALRDVLGEGEDGGPRIRYLVEPEPLGTGGAIRFASEGLEGRFLALNGDVLTDLDLGALLAFHEERSASASIGLYAVPDPSAYGLVTTSAAGEVQAFLEKPEDPATAQTNEVNAGIYVLERSVVDSIPEGRAVSIEREVFPRLIGHGLHAMAIEGYWMDIGTPDRYLQATWDILEGAVRTEVPTSAEGVRLHPGADVAAGAEVGPRAFVSDGCTVGPRARVRGSVLLSGCRVGAGAEVSDSILSPGTEVAPGAVLRGSVTAAGERVGAR
ncbi:MAG: NDP-sugar synthase [Solirubrobacterales bacterium]